ncbi:alkaline phosphatase [Roseospira marina]|uniref:Alkaline phosphatase n=1 Tax=Roseospira marina TaxID=140057 RepID=A0A5M6IDS5_9PROT|nr:alkaline phosphatase [Roseospira marina]KAA5606440.1 alkaline phosphatase [Roseospira marina]MBB4314145.1 alkaline phosphatase [Roseospira marina]MBB5087306.1 alkaline phosphatase [Roseospira marina]
MFHRLSVSLLATVAISGTAFAQDVAQSGSQMYTDAEAALQQRLGETPNTHRARNVILFIGDGNGVASNYMNRLWAGQQAGGLGDDYVQPQEAFPELALVKTYNINAQTPDSAPTAGSMNTGVKQRFNLINLGENAITEDCTTEADNALTLFSELVTDAGKSVGIATTARLTHATPAAVYAKTAYRNWEGDVPAECTNSKDIATQLIDAMEAGTVDVALGGGARYFVPKGVETPNGGSGRRENDVNLIERAQADGIQVVADMAGLAAAGTDAPILGLWSDSHASYEADRPESEPSLADMTQKAIEVLSQNENGFYLEVEAGRIDHANHATNAKRAMIDGKAFADAIALADEMTDDADTLIIVTADHEHAIAMNGYCGRGTPIDGLCYDVANEGIMHADEPVLASDGKPYTVVGYLNGASSVMIEQADGTYTAPEGRPEITQDEAQDLDYTQQVLIPKSSESHSGVDVALYAKGPWAHLFDGTIEQNYIFHVMNYAVNNGE